MFIHYQMASRPIRRPFGGMLLENAALSAQKYPFTLANEPDFFPLRNPSLMLGSPLFQSGDLRVMADNYLYLLFSQARFL